MGVLTGVLTRCILLYMNTNTFAQQAKIDADLARPTATFRNRIADSKTEYWSGDDHITLTYSDRGKGFRVFMELASDVAREHKAIDALAANGIDSIFGIFGHSFPLAAAEAVESYIRTAFPEG